MKLISCEKLEKSMVELQFSIDAETFKSAVNAAFKRESKKYAVPGFRKGKAPKAMIEKMYGADLFQYDAVNDLFPENYEAAVKEAGIEVVGRPDPEVVSMSEADGAVLKVKVAVKPEVELGEYAGLTVNKDVQTVDEADVDAEIKRMQDRNGRLLTREGEAQNGDTVDIDFEGFVDGVAFEGGKAEHYSLVLGSGSFIPGFEEQVVGHKAGEEFDVNVKFPEEYQAKELAGKDATFKIKLHEVQYKELPELDDDFAKDVSEYDTLDELKDSIRKNIAANHEKQADQKVENDLIDQIVAGMKADIPDAMIDSRIEELVQDFGYRISQQGLKLEQYLQYMGMTMENFKEQFREQADKQVKTRLAMEAIAAKESIEATEEEFEAEIKQIADAYQMEADKVKSMVDAAAVKKDLAVNKAIEFAFAAVSAALSARFLGNTLPAIPYLRRETHMSLVPYVVEQTARGERSYDIFSRLLNDRIIVLSEDVNSASASVIVAQLLYLEGQDPEKDIYFYINSPGGSISDGMAIHDTMNYIKCDVSTICVGMAASMGSFLLASGTKGKRFALPNSEILIHQPLIGGNGISGQATDIQIHANHIIHIREKMNTLLSQYTGQPLETIQRDTERDNYMTAQQAKEYGLIDDILYKH